VVRLFEVFEVFEKAVRVAKLLVVARRVMYVSLWSHYIIACANHDHRHCTASASSC